MATIPTGLPRCGGVNHGCACVGVQCRDCKTRLRWHALCPECAGTLCEPCCDARKSSTTDGKQVP